MQTVVVFELQRQAFLSLTHNDDFRIYFLTKSEFLSKKIIVMPKDSFAVNPKEVDITGDAFYLVDGLISDDGKITGRAVRNYGWYDAATLKEPYRIEGKKAMGL